MHEGVSAGQKAVCRSLQWQLLSGKAAHLSKETWEAIAVMTDNAAMLQKKDKYKTENGKEEEYNMCQALEELMEDNRNEGRREGRNEGNLEKTKTVVRNMLDRGYEIEDICAIAGCEASFVEDVRKELHWWKKCSNASEEVRRNQNIKINQGF